MSENEIIKPEKKTITLSATIIDPKYILMYILYLMGFVSRVFSLPLEASKDGLVDTSKEFRVSWKDFRTSLEGKDVRTELHKEYKKLKSEGKKIMTNLSSWIAQMKQKFFELINVNPRATVAIIIVLVVGIFIGILASNEEPSYVTIEGNSFEIQPGQNVTILEGINWESRESDKGFLENEILNHVTIFKTEEGNFFVYSSEKLEEGKLNIQVKFIENTNSAMKQVLFMGYGEQIEGHDRIQVQEENLPDEIQEQYETNARTDDIEDIYRYEYPPEDEYRDYSEEDVLEEEPLEEQD